MENQESANMQKIEETLEQKDLNSNEGNESHSDEENNP